MFWRVALNVLVIFIFVAAFGVWGYPILIGSPAACEKPIIYTIGTFDRRFNISQKDFLAALAEAESVWEKPSGIELFTYDPARAELVINLIYDYRKEVTSTLSGLENAVEKDKATYNALETRYATLKAEYNSAKSVYDTRVKAFDDANATYQRQVESWNRGKKTSKPQFDQLETARAALETEIIKLKVLEARLNEMVGEINSLVGILNRLVKSLNLNVETYNTIGASRGESFTGGIYYSDEVKRGIDIYEFSNREKLVRVMAHELGHALGIEHVDDPEAIMYYLNEGDAEVLTKADLAALKVLCYTKDIKN